MVVSGDNIHCLLTCILSCSAPMSVFVVQILVRVEYWDYQSYMEVNKAQKASWFLFLNWFADSAEKSS